MNIAKWSQMLQKNEHEVILAALCIVAVAFSLLNPLWYSEAPGFDASLFALMGKMWAGGEILYQDMIDIKGPGIFFIDLIGYRLGGYPGIAFVETLLLVFGVISVDLALRVFRFSPLSRFCSITTVISLLGLRYYYGNMTEDYALYLAMLSSYPYALLFYRRKFSWLLSVIPALVFAITLSIRVNNTGYMLAWYTMLFLFYCANGRLWDGIRLALSAIAGVVLVIGGFAYYFYFNGGMELLYQAYYYSVGIFFVEGAYGGPGLNFLVGTVGLVRTGCLILLIGFVYLLFSKDNNLINSPNAKYNDRFWFLLYLFLGVVFTIVANSVSGHVYDHYDQLFMAFMFIPLAFLMHRYLHVKQDIHVSFLTILCLLVFLISERVIFGPWVHNQQTLATVFGHAGIDLAVAIVACVVLFAVRRSIGVYRHNHTFFLCLSIGIALMLGVYAIYLGPHSGRPWDEETALKVEVVKANTEVADRIWVEGDMPQYYIWTDRLPASPYLFFSNVNAGNDLKTKVLNGIAFFKPKFIIIRERLVREFKENQKDNLAYNTAERNFFHYVLRNYSEILPGLFALRSEKAGMDLSLIKQSSVAENSRDLGDVQGEGADNSTDDNSSAESADNAGDIKVLLEVENKVATEKVTEKDKVQSLQQASENATSAKSELQTEKKNKPEIAEALAAESKEIKESKGTEDSKDTKAEATKAEQNRAVETKTQTEPASKEEKTKVVEETSSDSSKSNSSVTNSASKLSAQDAKSADNTDKAMIAEGELREGLTGEIILNGTQSSNDKGAEVKSSASVSGSVESQQTESEEIKLN